jgi:hypothetical protein
MDEKIPFGSIIFVLNILIISNMMIIMPTGTLLLHNDRKF